MNKKGFTITELLVTLFIVGVVLSAAYLTYIKLLKGFKSESEKISTQIESLIGLDILRLDLEHVGYGIPEDETAQIIYWDSTNKELILRTTLNNTNSKTRGYILAKCNGGTLEITYDGREDKTNNPYVVVIDTENKKFFDKGEIESTAPDTITLISKTCINKKIYIAFPVRDVVYNGAANGCSDSYCEQITYYLSNSNLIDRCNPNIYNLKRKVGTSSPGEPILNCVADWTVTFDIDLDGNGVIDSGEENQTTLPATNGDIRSKLKAINVYILVQEGRYDLNYTFAQASDCGSNKCVIVNGELLKLPADYIHYRWKPLIIKVKPMDL